MKKHLFSVQIALLKTSISASRQKRPPHCWISCTSAGIIVSCDAWWAGFSLWRGTYWCCFTWFLGIEVHIFHSVLPAISSQHCRIFFFSSLSVFGTVWFSAVLLAARDLSGAVWGVNALPEGTLKGRGGWESLSDVRQSNWTTWDTEATIFNIHYYSRTCLEWDIPLDGWCNKTVEMDPLLDKIDIYLKVL